jgi:hypothetical protein
MEDPATKLAKVRDVISDLRVVESQLAAELRQSEAEIRDCRVVEDLFHSLLYRYVGFELFDYQRAWLLPKKTYVAQSGRYVLLGFDEQHKATAFFDAAHRVTS